MNKITAVTIVTSLGAGSVVNTVEALEHSTENIKEQTSSIKNAKIVESLSSLTGIVTATSLNVRSTPDTSKTPIGKVVEGDVVNIISQESNGWYKINFNGKVGYVSGAYVSVQNIVKPDYSIQNMNKKGNVYGISTNISLNVRNIPSTDGDILYKLKNGDEITITGKTSNGWYRIVRDGKEGFAYGEYIKEGQSVLTGKVINVASNDTLNVRDNSSVNANVIYTLKNNTVVEIIEKLSNGWVQISYNGKTGYVNGKYISENSTTMPDTQIKGEQYEVVNAINLRKTAEWSGQIIKVINKGEILDVVSISGEWAKIYIDGNYAYAPSIYLKKSGSQTPSNPTPTTTKYTATIDINIRETAAWSGNIINVVKKGENVDVISISGEWAKIYYNGNTAYAPSKYIEVAKNNTTPEKPSIPETKEYVVTSAVNMRVTESWSGDIIKVIKSGSTVNVISISGEWAKIYDNGIYGYIPAKYLVNEDDITPEPPKEPDKTETVVTTPYITTEAINMRESASWSGTAIKVIKTGVTINVVSIDGEWAKIYDNGIYGYVPVKYITNGNESKPEKPEKPETPSEPESPETIETTPYITTEAVNMRETAAWGGTVIKVIKSGSTVNVVNISNGWAQIYENGIYGYIPASYVEYVKYTDYNYTLSEYIEAQRAKAPSYSTSTFSQYINPSLCNKYEFLELNKFREINVSKLNDLLKSKNAGVLVGQGQAIYNTAKKFNIDPIYFVSQSVLETGYGKSTLAKGVTITEIADESNPIKDSNGNITGYKMIPLESPVTVYNLYGIGAKDNLPTMPNRALILGTTYAYNQGWTTVEKAIEGAGSFVSSGYINNTKYNQNTLYKIRYNHNEIYLWHQYATAPAYAREIAKLINQFDYIYKDDVTFTYDKPRFKESKESQKENISYTIQEDENTLSMVGIPDITKEKPWEN